MALDNIKRGLRPQSTFAVAYGFVSDPTSFRF